MTRPAVPLDARELKIEGAFEFTPELYRDPRGLFVTTYTESVFTAATGAPLTVAQAGCSVSRRGVLRGVHFTRTPPGMTKYCFCVSGRALDFVVDLRVGSPTFGEWDSLVLGRDGFRATYCPVGVGHAFLALEDDTVMTYLMSSEYEQANELAVSPVDPELGLPIELEPILSDRDRDAPTLAQARALGLLPVF